MSEDLQGDATRFDTERALRIRLQQAEGELAACEEAHMAAARTLLGTEAQLDAVTARAERAEAAIQRMAELIDSYPPGSTFAQSGAQALFRRVLNGDTDGE